MESKPPAKAKSRKESNSSKENKGLSIDKNLIKIIRELIIEELTRLGLLQSKGSYTPPLPNFDDSMDIDLVRIENAKDLTAIEGQVEGISLPILPDSCSNSSCLPKEICKELIGKNPKLTLDTSKIHRLIGASTKTKSIGTLKNVCITVAPGCNIYEDFAVIEDYPYREVLLSRTCLRRYNYDLLESRKHVAFTCDGKDFFIPFIPDENRRKNKSHKSLVLQAFE
jgi:hypothetical protein